jgi:hypothetical protein
VAGLLPPGAGAAAARSLEAAYNYNPEVREEYRRLLVNLHKAFAPADAVEEVLIERMAVAWFRLARGLRFELRETQRATKIGGKRLPEHIQEPEIYDILSTICAKIRMGQRS